MEKYTFYVGFHNVDASIKHEVLFRDEKFKDRGKALKLLRALKEIFKYLRTGAIDETEWRGGEWEKYWMKH